MGIFLAGCNQHNADQEPVNPTPEKEFAATAAGLLLYVSSQGHDAATGTRDAPFASIERARDEIRRLKQDDTLPEGATVYIGEGVYQLKKSLRFTKEDSGTAEAPIVYQAVSAKKVVLAGGVRIHSALLKPISDPALKARIIDPEAGEKIVEVDLRALGVTDVGQLSRRGFWKAGKLSQKPPSELFIDGVPQTLARWPNTDSTVRMGEILDPGPMNYDAALMLERKHMQFRRAGNETMARQMEAAIGGEKMDGLMRGNDRKIETHIPNSIGLGAASPDLHKYGGTFRHDYDRPLKWADSDDIWITGIFGLSWEYSYNQVAAFDKSNRSVTLRYGEVSGLNKNWFEDYHHYENVFEEIDQPGEYYIDREAIKLYFYPPEIRVGKEPELILSTLDQPLLDVVEASHIVFRGLKIAGGRNDGVVISGSRGILLADLTIQSVAGDGVVIKDSFESGLEHCEIAYVGAKGVLLGGGDWPTLTPGGNFVSSCKIHDFAFREKAYNPGVAFANKSVGNRVSGSQIYNSPHGGIILNGNDHLIQGNDLHSLCLDFLDFGAIYANAGKDPMDRGTRIIGNYVHDVRPDAGHGIVGIYFDVKTWDIEVRNNVIYNIGAVGTTMKGHYLVTEDNLFCNVRIACWGALDIENTADWKHTFARYPPEKMPHGEKYPELLHFWEDIKKYGQAAGPLNRFAGNILFDPNGKLTTPTGADAKISDFGTDTDGGNQLIPKLENNLVLKEDPGFADWEAGNFHYAGSDPDLKSRLRFVNDLFDKEGRFVPAAEAGIRE